MFICLIVAVPSNAMMNFLIILESHEVIRLMPVCIFKTVDTYCQIAVWRNLTQSVLPNYISQIDRYLLDIIFLFIFTSVT